MSRRAQSIVRGRRIRRGLGGQLAEAIGFNGIFDGQVKLEHRDQSFRIQLGERFGLMRGIYRGVALAAHEKVQRNPREHFGEQSVRQVGRRFGKRQVKLFQSAAHVAGLQPLIAERGMGRHQQFSRVLQGL